jgi:hypothetical protein
VTSRLLTRLRLAGRILAVLAAALWLVVLLAPGASASAVPGRGGSTPTTVSAGCPKGSTCATIPARCPKGTKCPEVIVTPATSLGSDQWVFITAENFVPGNSIAVYYCQNTEPLSKHGPECMLEGTPDDVNPRVALTAGPNGAASISYAVQEDTDDGNPALDASVPGTATTGSFFCDNYDNPCSIDISDPQLGTTGFDTQLVPKNTAVVPITFQKPSGGCLDATFVNVGSEFGIDRVFPAASQFGCTGKAPSIGNDVPIDSVGAATGLAGGADQIALVDEPDAPAVQAALAPLKGQYSFIPVALSATVIGFKAIMTSEHTALYFPDNSFKLTPTMAAGLITNYYGSAENADLVANCGPIFGTDCSLLQALNHQPGFRIAAVYGAYVRSDASSSTGEVFNWICQAPAVPVYLGKFKTSDSNVAAQVLAEGITAGGVKTKTCPDDVDQFPSLTRVFAWVAASDPQQQAAKMSGFVPPPNVPSPNGDVAGFAPMNWSEANFYGLLPAALQNPAGNFVLPTKKSLYAAVAGAIVNKNGTISPNFDDKNPAAYPMPDIWYAVVPRVQATAVDRSTVTTLVNDLLNITAGSKKSALVPGFVPLPASLYKQAQTELPKSMVLAPTPTTTTTTTPATTATTTIPPSSSTTTVAKSTVPSTTASGPPTTTPTPPTTIAYTTTAFRVPGRSDTWMVPTFFSILAILLLFGPGLLLRSRKRAGA